MAAEPPEKRSPSLRRRAGLAVAIVVPALIAAAVVLAITGGGGPDGPPRLEETSRGALASGEQPSPIVARISDRGLSDGDRLPARALAPRPPRPTSIEIPAAGIASPVEAMDARGNRFELPAPYDVGWYRGGPRPGEAGRAVLIGHRDTKTGPAAFAGLAEARPGNLIRITAGGEEQRYRVTEAVSVAKSSFVAATIYGPGRRPALVLITCGGRFDQASGHYDDNVVVLAQKA